MTTKHARSSNSGLSSWLVSKPKRWRVGFIQLPDTGSSPYQVSTPTLPALVWRLIRRRCLFFIRAWLRGGNLAVSIGEGLQLLLQTFFHPLLAFGEHSAFYIAQRDKNGRRVRWAGFGGFGGLISRCGFVLFSCHRPTHL